jgi:hypothetical protein
MGENNHNHKWSRQTELYKNFFKKIISVKINRHSYIYHKIIILQNNKPIPDKFFWIYSLFFNSKTFSTFKLNSNSIHHLYNYKDSFHYTFDKNSSTSPVEIL